jgi:hypothetical protein
LLLWHAVWECWSGLASANRGATNEWEPLATYRSISDGAGEGKGSYEIGCLGSGSLGLLSLVEDLLVLLLGLHEGVLEVVGVYK